MGYEEVWKTLADLITELRKKGETIPNEIMKNLRSAKTMIQIGKASSGHPENIPRIETYLGTVEAHLLFTAQDRVGSEFAEKWMRKVDEARRGVTKERGLEAAQKFVPGLPRDKRWIRIQIEYIPQRKEIEKLIKENGLSWKSQDNGYILVYGDDAKIKSFVKTIAEKLRGLK